MCLIIRKPAGTTVDPRLLTQSFEDNPAGWGVMFAERSVVRVFKGFDFDTYMKTIETHKDKEMVIHTRYATHGAVNLDNCHPFKITKNVFMMHNGMINNYTETNPEMSDSWHFAKYLTRFVASSADVITDPAFVELVQLRIGLGNKIVFINSDGKISIANEKAGCKYQGLWLSNENSLWGKSWSKGGKKAAWAPGACSASAFSRNVVTQSPEDRVRAFSPRFYGLSPLEADSLEWYQDMSEKDIILRENEQVEFVFLTEQVKENIQKAGYTVDHLEENYQSLVSALEGDDDMSKSFRHSRQQRKHQNRNVTPIRQGSFHGFRGAGFVPSVPSNQNGNIIAPPAFITKPKRIVPLTALAGVIQRPQNLERTSILEAAETCGLFDEQLSITENAFWNDRFEKLFDVNTSSVPEEIVSAEAAV